MPCLGSHSLTCGTLPPGLAADIIAMPANPLDDLRALHDVSFVMKDGAVFKHDR